MSEFKFEPHKGVGKILLIVFIVLKLTGLIDWSWWWVTSPFTIPLAIALGIIIIIGFLVGLVIVFAKLTGIEIEF